MKPAIRPILAVENQTLREREREKRRGKGGDKHKGRGKERRKTEKLWL